jgi:hypothetical protein
MWCMLQILAAKLFETWIMLALAVEPTRCRLALGAIVAPARRLAVIMQPHLG